MNLNYRKFIIIQYIRDSKIITDKGFVNIDNGSMGAVTGLVL